MSQFIGISDFRRPGAGTASKEQPHLRAPDEFDDLQNFIFEGGSIHKRGGTTLVGSAIASASVRFLYFAYDTDSSTAMALAVVNTVLYYKIGGGAWTSLKTGLSASAYWNAITYKGHVYMTNGVNTPQDVTIDASPSCTDWVTLASSAVPYCVALHKNRVIYDHGAADRAYMHYTNFGDPNTTDEGDRFKIPDDQQGFFPTVFIGTGEWVGFFCEDYLVSLSGAGPFTFRTQKMPRGAPLIAWRTAVDMGGYIQYHTPMGVFVWDGYGPPEPVDPLERINYHDFNLATVEHTHAVRVEDEYWLFYRSKGQDTTATSATPRTLVASISAVLRTGLVRTVSASAPTTTSHYYRFNRRRRQWSGPHTGAYLSAAWQAWKSGHTQEVWVGSAWAAGKVAKAEQPTFTDVTATSDTDRYIARLRTGAFQIKDQQAPFTPHSIEQIVVMTCTRKAGGSIILRAYVDNNREQACLERVVPVGVMGPIRGEVSSPGDIERPDGAVWACKPTNAEKTVGYWPQLELEDISNQPIEIRGFGMYVTPAEA